jgi:hypothetical protein
VTTGRLNIDKTPSSHDNSKETRSSTITTYSTSHYPSSHKRETFIKQCILTHISTPDDRHLKKHNAAKTEFCGQMIHILAVNLGNYRSQYKPFEI